MKFSGKLALIPGGSSGIGLEIGKLFAQKGAHVWLLARHKDRLESAIREIESQRCLAEQKFGIALADVTDLNQVNTAVAEISQSCGSPEILVNSAGDVYPSLFQNTDPGIMRHLMEVNYFGTLNMTHVCLPAMLARRSGYIVNISSVYGFMSGYGYSGYCASKFAVRGFTDALRAELKPLGIGVSIVFPQNTETPQLEYENKLKPEIVKKLDNTKVMEPQEVAQAILRGIDYNKYVIIPGMEGKLLYKLSGISSSMLYWILDGMINKALNTK